MLLLRLWNYIRGYVIIFVEGYFLEKFINICIHRQIFLWDIKRKKNASMTLKISIDGFKMLRPVASKTGCRVRIVKKRGLPFILHRYKGRKTFVLGALVFLGLFFFLTSFVWTIEIKGNKDIETQVLTERLEEYGVKPGILKYNINTENIINDLMLDIKELAWVGIEVRGTKVKIEIAERVEKPIIIPKDVPCNLIAKKDGLVKSIVVKAGQELVKVGNTVQKGQVLVSANVPNKDPKEKGRLVHAIGTVKARTWYEKSKKVEMVALERERTGLKKEIYSLVLFSKRIGLFPGKISFDNFDKIEIKKKVSVGEDFELPFGLAIDRYYEVNILEKEIAMDEAKQIAADAAYKEVTTEVPPDSELVKTNVEFKQEPDGSLMAVVTMECIEDIGMEQVLSAAQTNLKN
jgi:similar to stage IV sporulation protein